MRLQKIKDTDGFKRDHDTNAILAVDNDALHAYKIKRRNKADQEQRLDRLEDDINTIKQMLGQLLNDKTQ